MIPGFPQKVVNRFDQVSSLLKEGNDVIVVLQRDIKLPSSWQDNCQEITKHVKNPKKNWNFKICCVKPAQSKQTETRKRKSIKTFIGQTRTNPKRINTRKMSKNFF